MRNKLIGKLVSILLVCVLVLSACGETEKDVEEQPDIAVPGGQQEQVSYELTELPPPDILAEGYDTEANYNGFVFEGFISDLQGGPAVYASSFSLEDEEYLAEITRWTMKGENDWKEDSLCQNSFSEFLNRKYEQMDWKRFTLGQFRRGDDGVLYGILTYYISEMADEDGVQTEMETRMFSVLQIDEEDDRIFEIPLPDFTTTSEAERGMFADTPSEFDFTDYHVFEDSRILFIYTESGGEFGKIVDGETGQTLEELGNIVNGRRAFTFGESEIIFFSNDDKVFRVLGVPGLEEDNTFGSMLDEDVIGKEWYFYTNPDTWELFLCNQTGVYSTVSYLDSDEVECLTENTDLSALNAVSDIGTESGILDFFMSSEEEFFICLKETTEENGRESNLYRILHYYREAEEENDEE